MTAHYVYVLRCGDDTLYTGYTTDVQRRVREHREGDGARYTRGRSPLELAYVESCDSRAAALRREHEIKSMSRARKLELVETAPDPWTVLEGSCAVSRSDASADTVADPSSDAGADARSDAGADARSDTGFDADTGARSDADEDTD